MKTIGYIGYIGALSTRTRLDLNLTIVKISSTGVKNPENRLPRKAWVSVRHVGLLNIHAIQKMA
jgi:hypothetical protein